MIDQVRGFAFPFRIDPRTGGVAASEGSEKIRENVRVILGTRHGERPMLREFGTRLHALAHDPNDDVLADLLQGQVREGLLRWEPRIVITAVQVEQGEDEVRLRLQYTHASEPVTGELSIPVR